MQYFTLLTTKGAEKIAAATAANTTVDLTHIALGDGNGSVVMPDASKTALVNEVYRASLNDLRVDANNANWVVAESNVPASQGNFWVREVGVFDTDEDLIAIGNYPETFKPVTADGVAKDLYMKVIFEVSSSDAVTLQVDPSVVMASQEFVNNKLEDKSDKNHNHNDIYAAINGNEAKNFLVKNASLADHAVNKRQLDNAIEGLSFDCLGENQTWQDKTSDRGLNITYINTTPRPIVVLLTITTSSSQAFARAEINGIVIGYIGTDISDIDADFSTTIIVPAGATYGFSTNGTVRITRWSELKE